MTFFWQKTFDIEVFESLFFCVCNIIISPKNDFDLDMAYMISDAGYFLTKRTQNNIC